MTSQGVRPCKALATAPSSAAVPEESATSEHLQALVQLFVPLPVVTARKRLVAVRALEGLFAAVRFHVQRQAVPLGECFGAHGTAKQLAVTRMIVAAPGKMRHGAYTGLRCSTGVAVIEAVVIELTVIMDLIVVMDLVVVIDWIVVIDVVVTVIIDLIVAVVLDLIVIWLRGLVEWPPDKGRTWPGHVHVVRQDIAHRVVARIAPLRQV